MPSLDHRNDVADRAARRRSARVRSVVSALLAVVLLGGSVGMAYADDIDDRRAAAEKRQQEILGNQEKLKSDLEDTDTELAQAVVDLQTIEARLPVAQAELDAANAEVERTQREAAILAQRLDDAVAEEATISGEIEQGAADTASAKSSIAEMARMAYRGHGEVSSLGIVTGAQSTEEFIEEFAISSTAARTQARTLEELQKAESISKNREARLQAVRETITDLKAEADQNVIDAQAARQAAADRKAEVESLIVQQKEKKATIESRKATALAQLKQADADQQALTNELKGIIAQQTERDRVAAEERAKQQQQQPQQGGGSANTGGGGGSAPPGRGFLSYPTAVPHVTSSFGYRMHPVLGYRRLHAGTDFRAYCGTPILASADGTVLFARTWNDGTKQVVIDHGWVGGSSLMTGYLHLQSWAVSPGQWVSRGSVIGYSGNTGVSTACHLHFEVYVNGNYVDPMTVL